MKKKAEAGAAKKLAGSPAPIFLYPLYFQDHLHSHADDSFGSLRCSVCLGKASEPNKLVKHILSKHGACNFQCTHCFARGASGMDMMLHTNIFHPGQPQVQFFFIIIITFFFINKVYIFLLPLTFFSLFHNLMLELYLDKY